MTCCLFWSGRARTPHFRCLSRRWISSEKEQEKIFQFLLQSKSLERPSLLKGPYWKAAIRKGEGIEGLGAIRTAHFILNPSVITPTIDVPGRRFWVPNDEKFSGRPSARRRSIFMSGRRPEGSQWLCPSFDSSGSLHWTSSRPGSTCEWTFTLETSLNYGSNIEALHVYMIYWKPFWGSCRFARGIRGSVNSLVVYFSAYLQRWHSSFTVPLCRMSLTE